MTGNIYEILGYIYAGVVAVLILITLIILKKRTKKKYNEILMNLIKSVH